MKVKTERFNIFDHLKTDRDIRGFLDASVELARDDDSPKHLIHALAIAAKAQGMLKTAKGARLTRAGLYRALSGKTDPRVSTIAKVANSLGYRLVPVAI
ncbi:MAG: putative addiction module antidote protein [Rickettsiales bacterium]|jgi:probable addiction module antidote protein|nr:putative addiction module antidote protein [Rickettsiales bacterium]